MAPLASHANDIYVKKKINNGIKDENYHNFFIMRMIVVNDVCKVYKEIDILSGILVITMLIIKALFISVF